MKSEGTPTHLRVQFELIKSPGSRNTSIAVISGVRGARELFGCLSEKWYIIQYNIHTLALSERFVQKQKLVIILEFS